GKVTLPTGKIPHKVSPVHVPELVGKHKIEVISKSWFLAFPQSQFTAVGLLVAVLGGIDPGQDSRLGRVVFVDQLIVYDFVLILSFGIYRSTFLLINDIGCKVLSVEQRPIAILLPFQIADKTDDVFGVVLVDDRVVICPDDDQGVRAVTDQDKGKRQQDRI